ncbi:MAG: ABC transporter permease [Spirochaetales bacterium]|nr:ABC transporter permease [Spirochaetales bacterium]
MSTERISRFNKAHFLEDYGMLLVLGVLFLVCAIVSPYFLKPENLLNITRQISVSGIISIGMTFVIITGGIDLSVGSVLAFSTLMIAGFKGMGAFPAFVIAMALSMAFGLVTGILVTKGKLQAFIATLGMMTAVVGIGLTYSHGHPIIGTPEGLSFLGQGKVLGIPVQTILFTLTAIIAGIVLNRTRLGRYIYAVGGNEEGSRLSGIRVDRVKTAAYVISSALSGFAGIIMANHLNVGEANLGSGMELDAIASVAVGGTSLSGGRGGVVGTVIGVIIIGILNNFLNLINVPGYTQKIVKGAIIIIAVLAQSLQANRKK